MKQKTILFIHGMYMNSLCWEHWVPGYQAKGFKCITPDWPGRNQSIDVLRRNNPDPKLGSLTLSNVVDFMRKQIEQLNEKPIIVGHSMGGLVVQLLLQQGVAAAGVAISSAPPMGVFSTKFSFFKSNWPHITPFTSLGEPVQMSFERFQYAFANTLPLAEQLAAFERYVVPESRRVPR